MKYAIVVFLCVGCLLAGRFWQELDVHAGVEKCVAVPGDVNADGRKDITDPVTLLSNIFLGDPPELAPLCDPPELTARIVELEAQLEATQVELATCNSALADCVAGNCPSLATFSLPSTGQTGDLVGCPQEGRFIDHGDGTITDLCTGRMWTKHNIDVDQNGEIFLPDSLPWAGAIQVCKDLEFAGYDDWRLPSIVELFSIVDFSDGFPRLSSAFDLVDFKSWSSTTYLAGRAYVMGRSNFCREAVCHEDVRAEHYFIAVRGGTEDPNLVPSRPPPPLEFLCRRTGEGMRLSWENPVDYDSVRLSKNGELLIVLDGTANEYVDSNVESGESVLFGIAGERRGSVSLSVSCSISVPAAVPSGRCTLPSTGQTECIGNAGEIDCDRQLGRFQDGYYHLGCPEDGRFVDNNDGTITDSCTERMWTKRLVDVDKNGQINDADALTWRDAIQACEDLEFAGYDDWRLPNITELFTILDFSFPGPSVPQPFDFKHPTSWSSTNGVTTAFLLNGLVLSLDKQRHKNFAAIRGGLEE